MLKPEIVNCRSMTGDDDDDEMLTFDRVAIKEKFERLDAEAHRTTIANRKKVNLSTSQLL